MTVERYVIFVDAGYLLAQGGDLICGVKKRNKLVCDYRELVKQIEAVVRRTVRAGDRLRLYWYDAAANGVPTTEQAGIGELPYVKLRMGRLVGDKQKGVDSLIYRDLTLAARNRVATVAVLITGDDDLREAIIDAQEMGMQVIVGGVAGVAGKNNMSPELLREADDHILFTQADLATCFTRAAAVVAAAGTAAGLAIVSGGGAAIAAAAGTAAGSAVVSGVGSATAAASAVIVLADATATATGEVGGAAMEAESGTFGVTGSDATLTVTPAPPPSVTTTAAEEFASLWLSKATEDEVSDLLDGAPRIPKPLDQALLQHVEAAHGGQRLGADQVARREARRGFWSVIRQHRDRAASDDVRGL